MDFSTWFTILVICLVMASIISNRVGVDVAMVGGLTLLIIGQVVDPQTAIRGFADPAVVMIGSLFIIAAGIRETGALESLSHLLLGRPKSVARAQARMMGPVAVLSGFMNNTPIVAMYLPIIADWARRLKISPSKLYMPLSFAAIMGSKITLIGTASNIIVMDLYNSYTAQEIIMGSTIEPMSPVLQFWGIAILGVPSLIIGTFMIVWLSPFLLKERKSPLATVDEARQYQLEMEVRPDSTIVGRSIENAGLRHLPGLYLAQIDRGNQSLPAVGPEEILQAGDRLGFVGVLDSVMDLRKIKGLVPATDQVEKIDSPVNARLLVEAVVSARSPLVRQTVRESRFRTTYNAAIIAVHRAGAQIQRKVGDITLQPGDTLLLDTHDGFVDAYRNSDDFYLISEVADSRPVRHERGIIALMILALMVILMNVLSQAWVAALVCAMLMIVTRCVTGTVARSSINWQVLLVIGAALGIGTAVSETGLLSTFADDWLASCSPAGGFVVLLVLFSMAAIVAQFITNYGAAALLFPIAMESAVTMGASPIPFVFTLMMGAGCSFMSPVTYQTNLMVYGPGGYRFTDYLRLGIPLSVITALVTAAIASVAFPLNLPG